MSNVSGVTLLCSCAEHDNVIVKLHEWLRTHNQAPCEFTELDEHYGGSKHPQQHVYGAGLNYLDEAEFESFVRSLLWDYPENVVLVIQPEDGSTRTWRPKGPWIQP